MSVYVAVADDMTIASSKLLGILRTEYETPPV
jgi:hypothetical protein